jgi:hypothetical protein
VLPDQPHTSASPCQHRPVRTLSVDHDTGRHAFLAQLDRTTTALATLDDHALLTPSRCHGWSALEVAVHLRTGLQELLGGVVSPTDATPDRDAASYWAAFPPAADSSDDRDEVDAILWTRRTASAYGRPRGAVQHLLDTAEPLRAAVGALADGRVAFQGHVLTTGDLLATWAVELVVHHLDLGPLVATTPPDQRALRIARRTVEALLGAELPPGWSDERCVLLGTGREQPTPAERAAARPSLAVLG